MPEIMNVMKAEAAAKPSGVAFRSRIIFDYVSVKYMNDEDWGHSYVWFYRQNRITEKEAEILLRQANISK